MNEKRINLDLSNAPGGKELIIREGKAPDPIQTIPIPVNISGTLDAPWEFWHKRRELFENSECHVQFNLEEGWLLLTCEEESHYACQVKGKLVPHALFKTLGVNREEMSYFQQDLYKQIRLLKPYFVDPEQHNKLMGELRNMNAKLTTIIKNADDQKGNKRDFIERTLQIDMCWDFQLNLPLFVGTPAKDVQIDIVANYESGSLVLYLESIDFIVKSERLKQELFDKHLENFAKEMVCIETV